MKTHKVLYAVISLLLIANIGFSQGVTVKPGTNLIIDAATTLKVADGDNLTLEDDLTHSPSLLERGSLSFSGGGEMEVEQYLVKEQYHIVSPPVSDEIIGSYLDMYLFEYDEPTDVFTDLINPLTTPLNAGEGYFVWSPLGAANYVTLNGTSNKADVPVTLTVTPATNNSGWNLLGNPFPCVVEWNGDASWALNNVGSTIYMFDPAIGNYKTWNFSSGIGTNGQTNGYIAATQGFWVRTSDTLASQSSYSLTIPAAERLADATTDFYKESNIEENILRILVERDNFSDEYVLAVNESATVDFDHEYDAYKLMANTSSPLIYSSTGSTKLSVNTIPDVENEDVIPLQFIPGETGTINLFASGLENFLPQLPVYLEDKKTQYFQDLRENHEYIFNAETSDETDRFVLHFTIPLSIDDLSDKLENVAIWSWEKSIIIDVPKDFEGEAFIYDILGKEINSDIIHGGRNELEIAGSEGFYIVSLSNENGIKTEKVFIK